jgi:hypothetical protein
LDIHIGMTRVSVPISVHWWSLFPSERNRSFLNHSLNYNPT